jgi:hypothetical protein
MLVSLKDVKTPQKVAFSIKLSISNDQKKPQGNLKLNINGQLKKSGTIFKIIFVCCNLSGYTVVTFKKNNKTLLS